MVSETLLTIPVAAGAIIVGPLIIGAAILALIGVGAVYLSGGRKRSRRLAASSGPNQVAKGERDPLDDKSTDELRLQSGEMLVAADNAVQSSEQELLFAAASYGQQKVATFEQDLEEAKEHLRETFRLQQQVDASDPEAEDQTRQLYKEIIRAAEKVDQTLQKHQDEFDSMRDLERNPQPAVKELADQLAQLKPRRAEAESALEQLSRKYDDEALDQYRDNLAQSAEVLQAAEEARKQAAEAVESSDSADAVLAIHAGERAAADARSLIESMEQTEERLDTARKNLDIGIAQTDQDIAQAKATREAGQAPELAGPIAAAQTAADRARDALAGQDRINPLELLQSLELAHRELDAPLNSVRNRQAKDRRAREMLDHELLSARNQVQSALDYLRSRRYGVSSTARTRMAEAERSLTEAQSIGDSQPSRAVELAQQAKTMAVQASQIAQQESATAGMQSMGGGYGGHAYGGGMGYGSGGFGGFGHGPSMGRRPRGFGYRRRRSGLGAALNMGMRMAGRASRGRRRF